MLLSRARSLQAGPRTLARTNGHPLVPNFSILTNERLLPHVTAPLDKLFNMAADLAEEMGNLGAEDVMVMLVLDALASCGYTLCPMTDVNEAGDAFISAVLKWIDTVAENDR